jgi:predicted ABC-type sugar transport system permease subunit
VGALVLAIIGNTMILLGVNFFWRLVATGIIIVLAVGLNMWRERVLRENI